MPPTYSRKTSILVLFLLGFLERFCYYGLYNDLVAYLTNPKSFNLEFEDVRYYLKILGIGIPISAIAIGILIDLVVKQEKAIFIGGVLIICSYLLFLFEEKSLILPSIILLMIGVNFVRPSLIILVGKLFKKEEKQRDLGFILFFLFINLGAFLSVFISIITLNKSQDLSVFIAFLIISILLFLTIFYFTRNKLRFIEEDLNEYKSFFSDEKNKTEMDTILDADDSARPTVEINESEESHQKMKPFLLIIIVIGFILAFTNLKTIGSQAYWGHLLNNANDIAIFGFPMEEISLNLFTIAIEFVLGIICFSIWYFRGLGSTLTKINLSFLFLAIGTLFVYLIMTANVISLSYWTIPILFNGLAEVLITTIALSYITRLSKMKYATTILGVHSLCLYLGGQILSAYLGNDARQEWLFFSIGILLVFTMAIFAFRKQLLNLSNGLD